MLREYFTWASRGTTTERPSYLIDLNAISACFFNPSEGRALIYDNRQGYEVSMTKDQYEDFKTNWKTTLRLKKIYE